LNKLIAVLSEDYPNITFSWRASRNRNYLQVTPTGLTGWQDAPFLFCSENGEANSARRLPYILPIEFFHPVIQTAMTFMKKTTKQSFP
jgi:hypothetical protein